MQDITKNPLSTIKIRAISGNCTVHTWFSGSWRPLKESTQVGAEEKKRNHHQGRNVNIIHTYQRSYYDKWPTRIRTIKFTTLCTDTMNSINSPNCNRRGTKPDSFYEGAWPLVLGPINLLSKGLQIFNPDNYYHLEIAEEIITGDTTPARRTQNIRWDLYSCQHPPIGYQPILESPFFMAKYKEEGPYIPSRGTPNTYHRHTASPFSTYRSHRFLHM